MADEHRPEEARSLLQMIWRHRRFVVIPLLLGVVVGIGISALGAKKLTVTSRIFLARTQPYEPLAQNAQQVDPLRYTANQVSLLTSTPVLDAASKALADHPSVKDLQTNTRASVATAADVITLSESGTSAVAATQRANAIVDAYRALQQGTVTTQSRDAAAAAPDAATRAQILAQAQIAGDGVAVVEPAQAAEATKSQSWVTLALLGGIIGLFLGVGAAVLADGRGSFGRRRKFDPAEVLGVPQLGSLSRVSTRSLANSSGAELKAARRVLTALEYASRRPFSGILLVASAGQTGDSNAVINLVTAAAADGRRVIVVDACAEDSGRGGQAAADRPSLIQLARPEVALGSVARLWTALPGLKIPVVQSRVADGEGAWIGPSHAVERALLRLSNEADLVVINAPSVSADETFLLIGLADAGVLVVTPSTKREELEAARSAFEFAGRPLIGFIAASGQGRTAKTSFGATAFAGNGAVKTQPVLAPHIEA